MKKFLIATTILPMAIFAATPVEETAGVWYESNFGEQTIWLNKDGSCKFNRGVLTLFEAKDCKWDSKGKMLLNFNGAKGAVFMKLDKKQLLMAKSPMITKYTADTILEKTDDFNTINSNGKKPFLGKWEALDHSVDLELLDSNKCIYKSPNKKFRKGVTCTWTAGKVGATLIFSEDSDVAKNEALFIKYMDNKLLLSNDKSELLPTRAKIMMVRVK